MLNFTAGPVQSFKTVLEIGARQIPYFRTSEFSEIILENECIMKKFVKADDNSRVVFITGSGTASMEAAVMNTLTERDKAIVINGGTFGSRFVQLCKIHNIPWDEIRLEVGKSLTAENLEAFDRKGYTAFLVNIHETSTGVYYDLDLISKFCKRNNLFLIVDGISSFLADEISMVEKEIDILITGSQKALACPPGISMIILSQEAISRVNTNKTKCLYFDLKNALKDGERGQTPFTPSVGILLQMNCRLKDIECGGGGSGRITEHSTVSSRF